MSHRSGSTPTIRTYEEAPNSEGFRLRAAVWFGTDNFVAWAEVSGCGEPVATEDSWSHWSATRS